MPGGPPGQCGAYTVYTVPGGSILARRLAVPVVQSRKCHDATGSERVPTMSSGLRKHVRQSGALYSMRRGSELGHWRDMPTVLAGLRVVGRRTMHTVSSGKWFGRTAGYVQQVPGRYQLGRRRSVHPMQGEPDRQVRRLLYSMPTGPPSVGRPERVCAVRARNVLRARRAVQLVYGGLHHHRPRSRRVHSVLRR
jgi:hypothetical protein